MSGRVCHVNDNVDGAVYIGRGNPRRGLKRSLFANPFRVEGFGRAAAISQFVAHLALNPDMLRRLPDLRGKPLACWCRHDGEERTDETYCHGDVLLAVLNHRTDEEASRAMADRRQRGL